MSQTLYAEISAVGIDNRNATAIAHDGTRWVAHP